MLEAGHSFCSIEPLLVLLPLQNLEKNWKTFFNEIFNFELSEVFPEFVLEYNTPTSKVSIQNTT